MGVAYAKKTNKKKKTRKINKEEIGEKQMGKQAE